MSTNAPSPETPTTTTINPVRKFLFERSFEGDLGLDFDEKPKPTFSEEQLEEAKKAAYEQGRLAGVKASLENEQRKQTSLLALIDEKLATLVEEASGQWKAQLSQLMEVAFVIARKVVPVYAEKNGLGEIEAIVARVIDDLGREPRLVIRVAEQTFDAVKSRIDDLAEKKAFTGKIVVLADEAMGPSDCRVEWADGGIERDFNKLWQEIDQIMETTQAPEAEAKAESVTEETQGE